MNKLKVTIVPSLFGPLIHVGTRIFERCTSTVWSGKTKDGKGGMHRRGFYWMYNNMPAGPMRKYVLGDDGRYYER